MQAIAARARTIFQKLPAQSVSEQCDRHVARSEGAVLHGFRMVVARSVTHVLRPACGRSHRRKHPTICRAHLTTYQPA
eukprot:35691-Pleurochrysis_carterae.AAC.1